MTTLLHDGRTGGRQQNCYNGGFSTADGPYGAKPKSVSAAK
ncbi:hypothetical protein [Zhongshania borealis]